MKFDKKNDYKYDFCFSGLIQNFNIDEKSDDVNKIRKKIFERIFYQFYGIKIKKKKNFKNYKIFWNSFTGRRYYDLVIKLLKQYKYLNYEDYLQTLSNSKTTINNDPGLIGPRYFEACYLIVYVLQKKVLYIKKFL